MKLLPLVENIIAEGLNLPKKKPVIYSYQSRCYRNGDPHSGNKLFATDECGLVNIADQIPDRFKIIDILLFDKYQGTYAFVSINDKMYKIWIIEDDKLWIEDYPIDNTSEQGNQPGFEGTWEEITDVIEFPDRYQQ